jgi:hypothetical protein
MDSTASQYLRHSCALFVNGGVVPRTQRCNKYDTDMGKVKMMAIRDFLPVCYHGDGVREFSQTGSNIKQANEH